MLDFLKRAKRRRKQQQALAERIETTAMLLGKLHAARVRALPPTADLREAEFRVYSQGGEDGILQFLTARVPLPHRTFIEFGVESYAEANTRFLLMNDDWKGLVIDASAENIERIRKDTSTYARHDLTAVRSFITRDNINGLFREAGFSGDIGLLSLDIDGNDYWIWEAIDCVSPRIVVCEYNSVFGRDAAVTIPYDPVFSRRDAHYSCLYFGASLKALCHLAERKGYDFVGSNTMGNNAFFVRKDLDHRLRPLTAEEGYVCSAHRMDSRDPRGRLTRLGGAARYELVEDLPVVDVISGKTGPLAAFAKA